MGASPIYIITPAPRMEDDPNQLVHSFDLISKRLDDQEYLKNTLGYLSDFLDADNDLTDRAYELSDEVALELVKEFGLKQGDKTPQEAVIEEIPTLLNSNDERGEMHPILWFLTRTILEEAIRSLCEVDEDGQIEWDGDYSWNAIEAGGETWSVFTTGGLSWGDSPTDSYDALAMIDYSGIFYQPFPAK